MYCKNCNSKLLDSQKFCQKCGASVPDQSQDEGPKKVKYKNTLIIGIVAVVIVLLVVATFAMMDSLKSPKQRYMETEGKFFIQVVNNVKEISNITKKEIAKSYQQKIELSVKPDENTVRYMMGSDNSSDISEAIGNLTLTEESMFDSTKNKYLTDVGLQYKDNKLLSGTLAFDNKMAAVKLPELYGKAMIIDTEKLDELYGTLGINQEDIPNRIIYPEEIMSKIKIDQKELQNVLKKYSDIFFKSIPDDSVTAERDKISIEDKDINCRKIVVEFKDDSLLETLTTIADEMRNDEILKKMTFENVKNIADLLVDAGYIRSDIINDDVFDSSNYKEFFSTIKDGISDFKRSYKFKDGIKMTLWVDSKGNTLKRKWEAAVEGDSYSSEMSLTADTYFSQSMKMMKCALEVSEDYSSGNINKTVIEFGGNITNADGKSGEGKEEFELTFKNSSGGSSQNKASINWDTKKTVVGSELKKDTDFKFSADTWTASGTIASTSTENKKEKESKHKYDISVKLSDGSNEYKGKINLNLTNKSDVQVNTEKFFNGEIVKLDNIDSSEMDKIGEEIQGNLQEIYKANRELFEILRIH